MVADNPFPLAELLVPAARQWVPMFQRWEELREKLAHLERLREEAVNGGDPAELARISKRIARTRAELETCQPAERYMLNDGRVLIDLWGELVSAWKRAQSQSSTPVNIDGSPLRNGTTTEPEEWLWHELIRLAMPGEEENS